MSVNKKSNQLSYPFSHASHAYPMLTDSEMHSTLDAFMQSHPILTQHPIAFIDEGTFTSVKRMRTLMALDPYGKHARAAKLELRGEWRYPVMMMNDCQLLDPDPPVVIVRDAAENVLARFKPRSLEELSKILRDDVFDMNNLKQRQEEMEQALHNRAQLLQNQMFLRQKKTELDSQLKLTVHSCVSKCDDELGALAKRLASRLNTHSTRVYSDVDLYKEVRVMHAFDGGLPEAVQLVSREVERLVYLALMEELCTV